MSKEDKSIKSRISRISMSAAKKASLSIRRTKAKRLINVDLSEIFREEVDVDENHTRECTRTVKLKQGVDKEVAMETYLPNLRHVFSKVLEPGFTLPDFRSLEKSEAIRQLGNLFELRDYNINLLSYWILEVLLQVLMDSQAANMFDDNQKMSVVWIIFILQEIANFGTRRTELFQILEKLFIEANRVVTMMGPIPSPYDLLGSKGPKEDELETKSSKHVRLTKEGLLEKDGEEGKDELAKGEIPTKEGQLAKGRQPAKGGQVAKEGQLSKDGQLAKDRKLMKDTKLAKKSQGVEGKQLTKDRLLANDSQLVKDGGGPQQSTASLRRTASRLGLARRKQMSISQMGLQQARLEQDRKQRDADFFLLIDQIYAIFADRFKFEVIYTVFNKPEPVETICVCESLIMPKEFKLKKESATKPSNLAVVLDVNTASGKKKTRTTSSKKDQFLKMLRVQSDLQKKEEIEEQKRLQPLPYLQSLNLAKGPGLLERFQRESTLPMQWRHQRTKSSSAKLPILGKKKHETRSRSI